MTTLTGLRDAIAAALADLPNTVTVYTHVPEKFSAPAVLLEPGDPYLTSTEPGVPFGHFLVRFQLALIADTGENEVATDSLDTLIETTTSALHNAGWKVERIAQPYAFTAGTALHLATDLTITDLTTF